MRPFSHGETRCCIRSSSRRSVPLLGQEPIELGMAGLDAELTRRLEAEPIYRDLFPKAFPDMNGEISLADSRARAVGVRAHAHLGQTHL